MAEKVKCIECKKEVEPNANLCVECGSHQDWRRHTKTWTPILGFVLAFLAFLFSISPQIKASLFPSPPKFSAHLRAVSERSMTFHVSNLGERTLIVDPVLRCVSGERIDEEIVDYEKPFSVRFPTIEGELEVPSTVAQLGGSEVVTFAIPEYLAGSWLENEPTFLPPSDERVSGISRAFSHGLRNAWFGADRSTRIPEWHVVGNDGWISLQPISEISAFCELTMLDPSTGKEISEGFAIWSVGANLLRGGRPNQLYDVLGSLIYVGGPGGLNETDPELCNSDSPPWGCITED